MNIGFPDYTHTKKYHKTIFSIGFPKAEEFLNNLKQSYCIQSVQKQMQLLKCCFLRISIVLILNFKECVLQKKQKNYFKKDTLLQPVWI